MAEKPGKLRRIVRWVVGAVLVAGIIVAAAWWFQGKLIWQDAGGKKLAEAGAKVRSVLWGAPTPLGAPINSADDEYEPCLSPDATELYFVRGRSGQNAELFVSLRRNSAWTTPVALADLNTPYDELGPKLSGDGQWLYFYSDRPGGEGAYDIWASRRSEGGWEKPVNLGPTVNSPFNEFAPAPTPDGKRLFFASNRKHSPKRNHGIQWAATLRQSETGDYDLFAAAATEASTRASAAPAFAPAVEMSAVNTPLHEGACAVSPGGDFLYFTSDRSGGAGDLDLWRARIADDGTLASPENLGGLLNSTRNESDPCPAAGGFRMYFSSDRDKPGNYDLYLADSREVFAAREARPVPNISASAIVLVLSVALMGFLFTMVRAQSRDLLTRCLLFSLLLHAALASGFSAVQVTKKVAEFVRQQEGMEVPLNLEAARLAELQLQLRNQITELVAPPPETTPERPTLASNLTWSAPQSVAVLPQPRSVAPTVTLQSRAISPALPRAVEAPVAPPPPAVDLRLPTPKMQDLLKAPELRPQPAVPTLDATRVEPLVVVIPRELRAPDLPVRQDARSMAMPLELPTRPPIVESKISLPPTILGPEVKLPTLSGTQVAGNDVGPAIAPGLRLDAAPPLTPAPVMVRPTGVAISAPSARTLTPVAPSRSIGAPPGVPVAVAPAVSVGDFQVTLPQRKAAAVPEESPLALAPLQPPRTPPMLRADVEAPSNVNPLPRPLRHDDVLIERPIPKPLFPELALLPPAALLRALPKAPSLPTNVGSLRVDLSRVTPDLIARDPEIRRAIVEEMGGSAETEAAVARALEYLARNQQEDGRWIIYTTEKTPRRSREQPHDPAMTGLATLCFLAANHRPDQDGPYRRTVDRALKYLQFVHQRDGNVRGDGGTMYDQAIVTLALAEAALMTGNAKYRSAAMSAANYIVEAQDRSGGWRYLPSGGSDLSITGWQVMALHSAENLGFVVPPRSKGSALRWIDSVTTGPQRGLAAYMDDKQPTASMTAQGIFSRILLERPPTPEQMQEASEYITKTPAPQLERDYYQFYCTSLMLMQLQNDAWRKWNPPVRDLLLSSQRTDGDAAGSWDLDAKWAPEGGRVYSTAFATLTLEVYYRYLPMYANRQR